MSPARREMLPEGRFERALWAESNLERLLRVVPMSEGMEGAQVMLGRLFPKTPHAQEVLGGDLDPRCPSCGVESDHGSVAREGEVYRLRFEGCGHELLLSRSELDARVQRAGNA